MKPEQLSDPKYIAYLQLKQFTSSQLDGVKQKTVDIKVREMKNTITRTDILSSGEIREWDVFSLERMDIQNEGSAFFGPERYVTQKEAEKVLKDEIAAEIDEPALVEKLATELQPLTATERNRKGRKLLMKQLLGEIFLSASESDSLAREIDLLYDRQDIGLAKSNFGSRSEFVDAIEKESGQRRKIAESVERALESEVGNDIFNFDSIVGIPVVGFGDQSPIIEETLRSVIRQDGSALYVFLVNYPTSQTPDTTFDRLKAAIQEQPSRSRSSYVVINAPIAGSIKMGNIRSGIFDGYILASNLLDSEDLDRKVFSILDDDFSNLSDEWISKNKQQFQSNLDLDLSVPTLRFIGPGTFAYEKSEKLRSVIAEEVLSYFNQCMSKATQLEQPEKLRVYQIIFSQAIEAICFSGFSMRASTYLQTGGFPQKDEITRMVRQIALPRLIDGEIGIRSGNQGIFANNRRAIATYLRDGKPSVYQWNGSYKFETDINDPVRTQAESELKAEKEEIDLDKLAQLLEDVIIYFDPRGEIFSDEELDRFLKETLYGDGYLRVPFSFDRNRYPMITLSEPRDAVKIYGRSDYESWEY